MDQRHSRTYNLRGGENRSGRDKLATSPGAQVTTGFEGGAMGTQRGVLGKTGDDTVPNDDRRWTSLSVLSREDAKGWNVDELGMSPKQMREAIEEWVHAKEGFRRNVLGHILAQRQSGHKPVRAGQLPNFGPNLYVLVARARSLESAPKLVLTWTEPWRVMSEGSRNVCMYEVRNIVTGETRNVQVARMRF